MGDIKPVRRLLRRVRGSFIWLILIAVLLAFIVFQHRRRMAPLHPPIALAVCPEYARVSVNLKPGTLPEIVADLSRQAGVPVEYLRTQGEAKNTSDPQWEVISRTCTLHEALLAICEAAKEPFTIDYCPDRVTIGTDEAMYLSRRCVTVVYPVGDLILVDDPLAQATSRSDRLARLADIIISTVRPDAWRESGGVTGHITTATDRLVISATPGMHWQIEELLRALRAR